MSSCGQQVTGNRNHITTETQPNEAYIQVRRSTWVRKKPDFLMIAQSFEIQQKT